MNEETKDPDDYDEYISNLPSSYSEGLKKACADPFDYELGLKNGARIFFYEATYLNEVWVRLEGIDIDKSTMISNLQYGRGMEVRVSEIIYTAVRPSERYDGPL